VEEETEACYCLFNNTDTRSELIVAERRMVERYVGTELRRMCMEVVVA
jgi:hypothetical protein